MTKTVAINQKTLGIVLLIALALQYANVWSLPMIGKIAILVVALLLILK